MLKKIKQYIINKLAPDYKRLKAENKELKRDIRDIVTLDKKSNGVATLLKYQNKFHLDRVVWQAETNILKNFKGMLHDFTLND